MVFGKQVTTAAATVRAAAASTSGLSADGELTICAMY